MNQRISRRRVLAAAAAGWVGAASALPADRSRPLRLIVALAAGGSSDAVARAVARHMEGTLGRPVVVDNRAGGQGAVAAAAVAGSPADGLTMLLGASSMVQNPFLFKEIPNHLPDLRPVSQVIASPNALAVSPKLGINTLADFVAAAKAKPGALTIGTVSTLGQALIGIFKSQANIQFVAAPYRGESQAIPDVLGGHISGLIGSPGTLLRNGLQVLAVANDRRSSSAPDVPTFSEAGFPKLAISGWLGIFVPVQTAADDVRQLQQAIAAAVEAPKVVEIIQTVGMEPVGSTPESFQALVARETDFWSMASKTLVLETGK